jgi:hypothetical protein
MQGIELEREALRRLPAILAELFDEPASEHLLLPEARDAGIDAVVDAGGRRWLVELKATGSPGVVAAAHEYLAAFAGRDVLTALVVPYMTPAGAKVADERRLNWIDLSGNAHLRDEQLHVWVQGRPNAFARPGRPSSAFAPKSSRVTRRLLLDPGRWWRQKELSEHTALDTGRVSRVVRRLGDEQLLQHDGPLVRPRDRDLLLDAWADEYRFDRHDIVTGHMTGGGLELARDLDAQLEQAGIEHAFTGLPAAWAIDPFARFRLNSVYVTGDPRDAADVVGLRRNERGANVQLIGPDDRGVFDGSREIDDIPSVSPVQVYLDLLNLPERAREAAQQMRADGRLWDARA